LLNNPSNPILQIKALSLRYSGSDVPALQEVSMNIEKGELIALVGESGSGKSSLLRALTGLEDPFSGSITLNNRQLFGSSVNVSPGDRNIGLVFQDYALFPHLNVADNISYGLKKQKDKVAIVKSYLQLVGLENYEKRYQHELSGGEQQRIALARALAPQPEILLLDEPFSNLDEALKDRLREDLFAILKQTETTAILVTHDIEDAMRVADRIAVLQKGQLRQMDTPQQLYQQPVDRYVAGFFGTINLLEVYSQGDGKVQAYAGELPISLPEGDHQIGIRPENWQLTEPEIGQGILAKVVAAHFLGSYVEIILEAGNTRIKVHVQFNKWQIGQEVRLEMRERNQYCLFSKSKAALA